MSAFEIVLELINEKLWLAVFIVQLFVFSCEKKPYFTAKALGGGLGVFALGLLPRLLFEGNPTSAVLGFWMSRELLLWPVLLALYMGVMFRCNWNMMLLSALAGLCVQETIFGLWAVVSITFPAVATPAGELLICAVLSAGAAAIMHRFLAIRITPRSLQMLQGRSLIPLLALYLLSALLISFSSHIVLTMILFFDRIQKAFSAANLFIDVERLRLSSIYAGIAGNVLVLLALRNMLRYSEAELERGLLEQIRAQDRKQYTHFRSNVDYINTKSHDLRHYLDLIQRNRALPREELERVAESLRHLDSETDSGNETLDLILTDRCLACKNEQIDLIFQTDGTSLEQLDMVDTYTIFCNILDNAIEYVKGLRGEERAIRLGIRTIHNMVFIHQENFFAGEIQIKDGLPVTTKQDQSIHGYGLKSVRDTVKSCGGDLIVRAADNRFEIDIYFPVEK